MKTSKRRSVDELDERPDKRVATRRTFGDNRGVKGLECYFYFQEGHCRWDDSCKYSHVRTGKKAERPLKDDLGSTAGTNARRHAKVYTQWQGLIRPYVRHTVGLEEGLGPQNSSQEHRQPSSEDRGKLSSYIQAQAIRGYKTSDDKTIQSHAADKDTSINAEGIQAHKLTETRGLSDKVEPHVRPEQVSHQAQLPMSQNVRAHWIPPFLQTPHVSAAQIARSSLLTPQMPPMAGLRASRQAEGGALLHPSEAAHNNLHQEHHQQHHGKSETAPNTRSSEPYRAVSRRSRQLLASKGRLSTTYLRGDLPSVVDGSLSLHSDVANSKHPSESFLSDFRERLASPSRSSHDNGASRYHAEKLREKTTRNMQRTPPEADAQNLNSNLRHTHAELASMSADSGMKAQLQLYTTSHTTSTIASSLRHASEVRKQLGYALQWFEIGSNVINGLAVLDRATNSEVCPTFQQQITQVMDGLTSLISSVVKWSDKLDATIEAYETQLKSSHGS